MFLDGVYVSLTFVDTGLGSDDYRPLWESIVRGEAGNPADTGKDGMILVYNVRDRNSLSFLSAWVELLDAMDPEVRLCVRARVPACLDCGSAGVWQRQFGRTVPCRYSRLPS